MRSPFRQQYTRRTLAREVRREASTIVYLRLHPDHINNGDEDHYRNHRNELNYIGNYCKALPHKHNGEVNQRAYRAMLRALNSGDPDDFERIPFGYPDTCKAN